MKKNTVPALFLCSLIVLCVSQVFAQVQSLVVYGSTTCISRFLEPGAAALEKAENISIRTVGVGTGQGLFSLLQGRAEVSAASEDLESAIESAKKYAVSKGMPIRISQNLQFHKIADDEVVVIVHKNNPVKSLTWKQLKGINTGTIKNWKEVGGPDLPIKVITSHDGSATRLIFQKLVMESDPYTPGATIVWTTEKEILEVSNDQSAIGAVSSTFQARAVGNSKTISTERITRPLGLVTVGKPSPKVAKVIDFFRNGEGRKFVKNTAEN